MSSDEDDYMSDRFLSKCVKEDTRPGLIRNRAKQREFKNVSKKARIDEEHKNIQRKPNERERLEEGLKNAIDTQNKGFAMLAKMGYKQGESLGKNSKGIIEPINITIKSDRGGLGREAAIKEIEQKKQEIRRKRLLAKANIKKEISTEEFRKRVIKKAEERSIEIALGKCQRACEKLDEENGIREPEFLWFWPDRKQKNNEEEQKEGSHHDNEEETKNDDDDNNDDDDEIEFESAEKLEMITNYLRTSYNYCHWCGVHYNNVEDITQNCPGLEKDDH